MHGDYARAEVDGVCGLQGRVEGDAVAGCWVFGCDYEVVGCGVFEVGVFGFAGWDFVVDAEVEGERVLVVLVHVVEDGRLGVGWRHDCGGCTILSFSFCPVLCSVQCVVVC